MTTTAVLVRHASHGQLGRVLCGRGPGVHLGEVGRTEAEAVAGRLAGGALRGGAVAAVYASPQDRARETAEGIALACRIPLVVDPDLDEVDFGDWTGMAFDDLGADPLWSRWNADRGRTRAPGGETLQEAQMRAARWLTRVAERHPRGTVVGVSHGDVIKAALAHVLGLPLHFYDRFEIAPASISVVAVGDWGMKVERINEAVA